MTLALEPIHRSQRETTSFVCSILDAVDLLDDAGLADVGLLLDLYNVWDDPSFFDFAGRASYRIAGVHVADWPEEAGRTDRVLPGEGISHTRELVDALALSGWDGYLDVEIFSEPDRFWGLPVDEAARRAHARSPASPSMDTSEPMVEPLRPEQHACGEVGFTPTRADSVEETIARRFAATVERHRGCIAVVDGNVRLSYAELEAHVTRVAGALEGVGIEPGDPVALLTDQGASAIAAVLGVLHAGGAFAPLDVLDPPARTRELLELAGTRVLLSSARRLPQASAVAAATGVRLIDVDHLDAADRVTDARVTPDSPASIFFTSGSTGRPKAVIDIQRNILHNTLRYTNLLEISPGDRLSLIQRMSFSGISSSLFGALLNGGSVCTFDLTPESLPLLASWVERERITVFHSVPAIFRAMVAVADGRQCFSNVRVVRLEGDRASWHDVELFRRWFSASALLANGLGTTETGLACQYRIAGDMPLESGPLPVGYAAPGIEIAILDEHGEQLPEGEIGEIAVRSRFLARGYMGAPALTTERFLDDPTGGDRRTYRTGDLGRVGPRGRVDYLGRRDGNLKIRGVRVEPAEVEAALLRLAGVREAAVVVVAGRGGGGRLVARVVPHHKDVGEEELQGQLLELVPDVMIPTRIELVPELAVDANWKAQRSVTTSHAAATEVERQLRTIWEEVLETEVGLDDTFVSLGGDSLAAAEIVAAVERTLGIDLPSSLLAHAPTVSRLAAALGTRDDEQDAQLVVLRDGGSGTPLILVPERSGNPLMYARVARAVDPAHPVWSFRLRLLAGDGVPTVAARVAAVVRAALPDGPYVVAGFCYGALVTCEVSRTLRADGARVVPVLLGLSPADVPTLMAADALAGWRASVGAQRLSVGRVRYHLRRARQGTRRGVMPYLVRTAGHAFTHARHGLQDHLRATRRHADRSYAPAPLTGAATVILSRDDVSVYPDDPATTWAGVAEHVDVRVVDARGDHMGFLHMPGAWFLGLELSDILQSVDQARGVAQTVP